jgi:hypothetical protein
VQLEGAVVEFSRSPTFERASPGSRSLTNVVKVRVISGQAPESLGYYGTFGIVIPDSGLSTGVNSSTVCLLEFRGGCLLLDHGGGPQEPLQAGASMTYLVRTSAVVVDSADPLHVVFRGRDGKNFSIEEDASVTSDG